MQKNKTICIIEDNSPNRKLFSMLIKKSGYNVADFGTAKDSLDWLSTNSVDLILLDILLPDMNGPDVLVNIRKMEHLKETKVVAITGFTSAYDKEKFLTLGFDGFLAKPINTNTFIDEIEGYLNN